MPGIRSSDSERVTCDTGAVSCASEPSEAAASAAKARARFTGSLVSSFRGSLLGLDAGFLEKLAIACELLARRLRELLRRAAARREPLVVQPGAYLRIGERLHDGAVELRHDVLRSARGGDDREPRVECEAREPRLGHARHLGKLRQTRGRRDADEPHLAAAYQARHRGDALERHGHLAARHTERRRVAPLYGTCVSSM